MSRIVDVRLVQDRHEHWTIRIERKVVLRTAVATAGDALIELGKLVSARQDALRAILTEARSATLTPTERIDLLMSLGRTPEAKA